MVLASETGVPALAGLLLVLVPFMLRVFRPPTQLFMFVLLLQHAVPTAINMSVRGVNRARREP
jgi:hypothetical protein